MPLSPHQSLQVAVDPAAGTSPARAQPSAWGRVPTQRQNVEDAPPRDQDVPWHSDAVCRRDEAGLFFAPSKEPTAARLSREEAAKRVCARCPVMVECREHALLQPEPYGVWGGLTAAERRVVLARRRRRELELKKAARAADPIAAAG
ncbi:WhiB family transcriptional regulator [Streptomyces boluensis]|uniref:WhiB family transcriptional regulator n=1 Tax=Streptomyces boluensis TaxID=1775135 RepID=UPI0035E446AD